MDNIVNASGAPDMQGASNVPGQTPPEKSSGILKWLVILLAVAAIAIAGWFAYQKYTPDQKPKPQPTPPTTDEAPYTGEIFKPQTAMAQNFADYKEVKVNVSPKVKPYTVKTDFSNAQINKRIQYGFDNLSNNAKKLLAKNAFVVRPGFYDEFFQPYESQRYDMIPNFVTVDSMLHTYHLFFDHLLQKLEEQYLSAELKKLNAAMLNESLAQYDQLKGAEWENAAKRNLGFFAIGGKLLDSSSGIPQIVQNEVEKELDLINKHEGIAESPIMNIGADASQKLDTPQGPLSPEALKEDYSQYIPRGHYDKTESLKAYFKSMMWYGHLTFRFKNDDEIRSAALIALSLMKSENKKSWDKIYEPTNFFVGKSDDITFYQLSDVMDQIYGANPDLKTVARNKEKFAAFTASLKKLEPPQINSMPIFEETIQPDREKEILGFRFMGQRFTIDASVFQRLIYREVKENSKGIKRMLPKNLDIPAAMGSKQALTLLAEMGETDYANYSQNMDKMQKYIAGLKTDTWTQNLYWGWLYSLLPLTTEKSQGYPSFMTNLAWTAKELNTYLGSWTELKHDTILYAKQAYAELGGAGFDEETVDDRGYVEPNPYVYARLAGLLEMTKRGLVTREIISKDMADNLDKMQTLALSLKTISEKELNNEKITDDEYELIRSYGGQLEHFWYEVNREDMKDTTRATYLNENPAAIVADVATDPNGQVLEEATGKIFDIYVIAPIEGKLKLTKGAVYSQYEFTWPLNNRLTDKKWREILADKSRAPNLSNWTKMFIAE